MCDLVFLASDTGTKRRIFSELDKDALVVLAWKHFDGRARELCRELVHSAQLHARLFAFDKEARDGWVVRDLLGEEGDPFRRARRLRVQGQTIGGRGEVAIFGNGSGESG